MSIGGGGHRAERSEERRLDRTLCSREERNNRWAPGSRVRRMPAASRAYATDLTRQSVSTITWRSPPLPEVRAMEIPDWTSPIDCPACGASSETGLAVATVIDRGVDVACACGLLIVDGSITNRGADRPLEDLYNDTRWPVIGWLDPPAYRAPAERRYALRLVPVTPGGTDAMPAASAAPDRPVTSVTIRFNRAHRPGGIAMTPYRAVQRAIRLVIVATALALGTAALLWAVLGHAGIALPFPTILAAVALVAVWSVVSSSGSADRTPPPSPPPGPPRVPPTWADAERMASLHRQGLISREELDRVLRELVPPGPPPNPPGRRSGRH
jgi:hypothetical protein